MRQATFEQGSLTYTGVTATERSHRWDIAFAMFYGTSQIGELTLTVTADSAAEADLIGERCVVAYAQTGRVPNVPEQRDPMLDAQPNALESIKALRFHTGQPLSQCYEAYARRHEVVFGGDPVFALTSLMANAALLDDEPAKRTEWARDYAEKFRREEPKLDALFPLAA
jgi:hypothetical protein